MKSAMIPSDMTVTSKSGLSGPFTWLALFLFPMIVKRGVLKVTMPGGRVKRFGKSDPNFHDADITIHHNRVFQHFLVKGASGFYDAYIDGDWSSSDTARLFELLILNARAADSNMLRRSLVGILQTPLRPDPKMPGMCHQYELTNAFFAQWLGHNMHYTSGLWQHPDESLEVAQQHAYAQLCRRLGIESHHRVLEIGCAWGGFTEYVARNCGARIISITASPMQYAFTKNRIESAGLSDRADVQMIDWRDIQGQYDRIISIEKLTKIGEANWQRFFDVINDRLIPGGRAEIQTGIVEPGVFAHDRRQNFIQTHIFPGSKIATKEALKTCIEKAGMLDFGHFTFSEDYGRTFRIWHDRFQEVWPQIAMLGYDELFKRCWEMFMKYCEAGFRTGTINVIQKSMAKPHAHKTTSP